MFSNYQWLLIGVIIACSCLVIYGSSSTSIKEGLATCGKVKINTSIDGTSLDWYDPGDSRGGGSIAACCDACINNNDCQAWEWSPAGGGSGFSGAGGCLLKTDITGSVQAVGGVNSAFMFGRGGCPIDPYYKRCWNECAGDVNCHSRPTTDAMRAAGAPDNHETCDAGYKSACGPGPQYNTTDSPPGCRLPCVKAMPPPPPPPPPSCAAFLSHNDCPTGTTSKAANTTCTSSSDCGASDCCTPNPQCSSLGSCPTYSRMSNPDLVCQGPVCDNTIGGECCVANPVCSADVCDLNTQIFTGAGKKCGGPKCAQIECCKSRAKCSEGVTCNPNLYNKVDDYSSKYCNDVTCELSECCKADPTCHNYTCPQYYTDKTSMSSIKCGDGKACDTEQCCDLTPTCSSYFTGPNGATRNGGCPAHKHLKKTAAEIRCLGPKCTAKECCGTDTKCSSFQCPEDNLYHTYTHVANAADIPCTDDHCTQNQCCAATPTYALPKVQTYPVYKTNMFHHGGGSTLNQ